MIKFFQKLKAKKGFTLVELIVVIAIIGVLAAILIPTMLGYVTSSRVQSANSTAAELKNMLNNFITDMDTKGYTFDRASDHTCIITKADASTDLTVTFSANSFKSGTLTDLQNELATRITNDFGFTKAYAIIYVHNGKPVGCAYSADALDCSDGAPQTAFTGDIAAFTGWGDTDGVAGTSFANASGTIVGTSPILTKAIGQAAAANP